MINSRRTLTDDDQGRSCATCKHLQMNGKCFRCGIDGAYYADNGLITMFTCIKYKEVKKNGGVRSGPEAR